MHARWKPMWAVTLALAPLALGAQEPSAPPAGLHVSVLQGDLTAVRHHIETGADLNGRDAFGSTPLMVAATFGRTAVARVLVEAGADPNLAGNDGGTALHTAAFFCHPEIVRMLLDHGADRYARDRFGNTALDAVAAPFDDVKAMYDRFARALRPVGLHLDYDRIRNARPRVMEMLRPSPEELAGVDYTPLPGNWKVSTPAAQGLDARLVAELYRYAGTLSTLYGLLVIKHDHLVAERYFNAGSIDQLSGRQSATKSFTSALVGVALDRGCLSSVDQKLLEFFPELAEQIVDPRKRRITIRHLLQMRGGYPWEERVPPHFELLFFTDNWHWLPHIVDFPLTDDPGAAFGYSNLTSHLLGVIVARACDTDLKSFAQAHLLAPIGAEVGAWTADPDGYNWGWGELHVTARDMARFGALYLHDGRYQDRQVLPADWVTASLHRYSEGMYDNAWHDERSHYQGPYLRDVGYGYQWWSGRFGEHQFDFAWGHGGNLIILLHELDMIVVTTADPLYEHPSTSGWPFEVAIINLVGRFIRSLPTE